MKRMGRISLVLGALTPITLGQVGCASTPSNHQPSRPELMLTLAAHQSVQEWYTRHELTGSDQAFCISGKYDGDRVRVDEVEFPEAHSGSQCSSESALLGLVHFRSGCRLDAEHELEAFRAHAEAVAVIVCRSIDGEVYNKWFGQLWYVVYQKNVRNDVLRLGQVSYASLTRGLATRR